MREKFRQLSESSARGASCLFATVEIDGRYLKKGEGKKGEHERHHLCVKPQRRMKQKKKKRAK